MLRYNLGCFLADIFGNAKLCVRGGRGTQGGRRQYSCLYGRWGSQDDKSSWI